MDLTRYIESEDLEVAGGLDAAGAGRVSGVQRTNRPPSEQPDLWSPSGPALAVR